MPIGQLPDVEASRLSRGRLLVVLELIRGSWFALNAHSIHQPKLIVASERNRAYNGRSSAS